MSQKTLFLMGISIFAFVLRFFFLLLLSYFKIAGTERERVLCLILGKVIQFMADRDE